MNTNVLLARFDGVPSLIAPDARGRFEAMLSAVMTHPRAAELVATRMSDDGFWPAADDWRAAYRPYVVRDGILHIPVKGVLLDDFPWALGSWATGYAYIRRAFDRGVDDPGVRGIAFRCDSPGGAVAENFELVDRIFAARGVKPIRAFAHESAYSGAYSIASAADSITVSRTGGVGSIGVVTAHVDVSAALANMGIKVTFIFAGAHKVDGNSYEALPADVKARIKAWIDNTYGIFAATVARNRGLDEAAVRATEAECFMAAEAVENGLADAIGPLEDAVAAFAADLSRVDATEGDDEMSTTKPAATEAAKPAATPAATPDPVVAAPAPAPQADGKAAADGERARIAAILDSDEAKGRESLAKHFAFKTAMSPDDAKAALAAAPKQSTEAPKKSGFEAAMAAAGNPDVGAGDDGGAKTEDQKASEFLLGGLSKAAA